MYVPLRFAVQNQEQLHRIVRDHPLGALVRQGPGGLDADHVPFEFSPEIGSHGLLSGHVARANPLWQTCPSGSKVMVIFSGAHAYISPSWYPSKHETHRHVPTWNYEVVHAHGLLKVREDEQFLRGIVSRLTQQHEAVEAKPWTLDDSSPQFIDNLLRNIVGLEISITSLVGKAKLGQHGETRDREGASDILESRGHAELAALMRSKGSQAAEVTPRPFGQKQT